jgi:hypothetical protein
MFNREVEEVEKGKEVFHSLFNLFNLFDFAVNLPVRKPAPRTNHAPRNLCRHLAQSA